MQLAMKIGVALVSVCAIAVLGDWILYEWDVVRPVDAEAASVLAQADPEDRNPPPVIRRVVLADLRGDSGVANQVARLLETRLWVGARRRNFDRELHELLVAHVCEQLSEQQLIGLYATLAFNGVGQGMNSLSLRQFAKPLHQVSLDEAATLQGILRGPSHVLKSPQRLQEARARVLVRLGSAPASSGSTAP